MFKTFSFGVLPPIENVSLESAPPPRRLNGGGGAIVGEVDQRRTDDNGEQRDPTRVSHEPTPPLRVACGLSINIYRYFSFFIIITFFYRLFYS